MRRWVALLLLTVLAVLSAPPASPPCAESRPATASTAPGPTIGFATLEHGAGAPSTHAQQIGPLGFTARSAVQAAGRPFRIVIAANPRTSRYLRDERAFIRRACWQFKAPASRDGEPPRIG